MRAINGNSLTDSLRLSRPVRAMNSFALEHLEGRRLLAAAPWGAQDQLIHLDLARQNFPQINGAGESVAIIDSGVDYNHPALGGRFGPGHKVVGGYNFQNNSTEVFPPGSDAHGTGTAGQVGGNQQIYNGQTYSGIAPGAQLLALDAAGTAQIKAALDWIIAHRVQFNIVAVNYVDRNNSDESAFLGELQQLNNAGVFIGGAVGNYGPSTAIQSIEHLIYQVGSVDTSDHISSFTPRGPAIDLLAPGENVVITWYQNGQSIDTVSWGTSWAGPQAVGTAALIKQINPKFTPAQIMSILRDSGAQKWDAVSGMNYPRLDVNAAIVLAIQRTPPVVQTPPAPAPVPQTPGGDAPFWNTPFAIGQTIQAEDYDSGGEGVSFHDLTPQNQGGDTYRGGGGVDTGWTNADGGSHFVGWTQAGEWMNYSLNAATAGSYDFAARVSTLGTGGAFHVEIDGVNATGLMQVPNTGAWTTYTTLTASGIQITAGKHIVRVVMDQQTYTGNVGNFDWFQFTPSVSAPAVTKPVAPIQAPAPTPAAPDGMTVVAASTSSLTISWEDQSNDETAFVLERSTTPGGVFAVVITISSGRKTSVPTGLRTYVDVNLAAGTMYYYRVTAINAAGSSLAALGNGSTLALGRHTRTV